jgi:hypothetical protein
MLPLPTWSEHPFSDFAGPTRAWYVLLVPTINEGREVLEVLPPRLATKHSEFTVLVACSKSDPTRSSIERAAEIEGRIIPVVARSNSLEALEEALVDRLRELEKERGRKATDALIVPLPLLELRRL